jgi:hypothetical protein
VSSLGLQSGDNEPVMITLIIPKEGVGEGVEFEQREEDREIDSGSDQLSASRVKGDDENLNEVRIVYGQNRACPQHEALICISSNCLFFYDTS